MHTKYHIRIYKKIEAIQLQEHKANDMRDKPEVARTHLLIQLAINYCRCSTEDYLLKWSWVSFLIWGNHMNPTTQPIVVMACNKGVCSAIYYDCIWDEMIPVHMLNKLLQVCLFPFLLLEIFPWGQVNSPRELSNTNYSFLSEQQAYIHIVFGEPKTHETTLY